jgi:chorismate mutase
MSDDDKAMTQILDKPALSSLRAQIDIVDAELRALLKARADLVDHVIAAKADDGALLPVRPWREAAQMVALADWQTHVAPALPFAGFLAIWREIIGGSLAQQGGLTIVTLAQTQTEARAHFGASLDYQLCDNARDAVDVVQKNPRSLAVLPPEAALATGGLEIASNGACVFNLLPVLTPVTALCYGAVPLDLTEPGLTLVRLAVAAMQADGGANLGEAAQAALDGAVALCSDETAHIVALNGAFDADMIAEIFDGQAVWLGNCPQPLFANGGGL